MQVEDVTDNETTAKISHLIERTILIDKRIDNLLESVVLLGKIVELLNKRGDR